MDSISTARDFFINQQGLSPDQADMIVSKGMEAYNQQSQPQSMMQMASGGRIGYAFGKSVSATFTAQPGGSVGEARGIGGLLAKAINNNPQMFRPAQELPSRARLYQTRATDFIDENQNGIDDRQEAAYGGRIGYQMGGVSTMPMDTGQSLQVPQQMPTNFSSAQSITMNPLLNYGQPELGQAGGTPLSMNRGGIARLGYQMGGEAVMPDMSGTDMSQMAQMDPQQALTIILQMLVEKGIPLEEAQRLAIKIIELFTQGGAPAVEEYANQLKQQEQSQAMASGGVAGYAKRQGYFLGGIGDFVGDVFGGIGDVVESIAKSPIGKIAMTAAAVYFGGPMLAGGLGISSAAGAALAGGLANSALQIASGQKFNPFEALISAGGAYAGAGGFSGAEAGINPDVGGITDASQISNVADYVSTNPTSSLATAQQLTNPSLIPPDSGSYAGSVQKLYDPGMISSTAQDIAANQAASNIANAQGQTLQQLGEITPQNFLQRAYSTAEKGITNLYNDPLKTIGDLAESAYDKTKENIVPLGLGFTAGYGVGAGLPQQPGESDEDFAKRQQQEVSPLITQYGRNLQIRNPNFYKQYGAVNPFETAAQGGIMGYKQGGSMVPPARQIEGGIIELDARKTGGYIPYGKKERVDDVPAMLAKDEFVFTSRAVKAAGGGSAQKGAAKMYALMKQLEGARA